MNEIILVVYFKINTFHYWLSYLWWCLWIWSMIDFILLMCKWQKSVHLPFYFFTSQCTHPSGLCIMFRWRNAGYVQWILSFALQENHVHSLTSFYDDDSDNKDSLCHQIQVTKCQHFCRSTTLECVSQKLHIDQNHMGNLCIRITLKQKGFMWFVYVSYMLMKMLQEKIQEIMKNYFLQTYQS